MRLELQAKEIEIKAHESDAMIQFERELNKREFPAKLDTSCDTISSN